MKIKRTLPSYTTYMDTNTSYNQKQRMTEKFNQRKSIQFKHIINQATKPSRRSSPKKPIFTNQRHSSPEIISNSLKKTVTFAHISNAPSNTKAINYKDNSQITNNSRIRKRRIFEMKQKQKDLSFKTQQKSQVINVKLNIKQLSEKLKGKDLFQQHKQTQDNNILRKITNLQTIVKDIQSKVNSHQKPNQGLYSSEEKIKVNKFQFQQQHQIRKYYDEKQEKRQNKLLKMQLQQMRRCEKIAKQNQLLYGKLAKNIQSHQNSLNQSLNESRKKSISSIYNSSYGGYKKFINSKSKSKQKSKHKAYIENSQNKRNRIIAFEDFDHFESSQYNKNNFGQQQYNDLQITSPFLIEQNRKSKTIR